MPDFNVIVNRKNTSSIKWDYLEQYFGQEDALPMWVADMDFLAPPEVSKAIMERAAHGIFGYTNRPPSYYQAIMDWLAKRHGWDISRDWICDAPGVVPSIALSVNTFTQPNDKILIQSPVYYPFSQVIRSNNRELVDNPLQQVDGCYRMDFDDLESKLASGVRMAILCSPHNPVGRVWLQEELVRFGELCLQNNILIVSDEIWSDIIFSPNIHIPISRLNQDLAANTITCMAPSKTFNLAGLSTSFCVIPNPMLRKRYNTALESYELDLGNVFGITALEAAYANSESWLDELIHYLEMNLEFAQAYISQYLPEVRIIKPEGTYLLWLDFNHVGIKSSQLKKKLLTEGKVAISDGRVFGPGGIGFQRVNLACPRSLLEEGLQRIVQTVTTHRK